MEIAETLLAQLEREAPATRKALERVPAGRDDWKPHPKSMGLGYLSTLVAIMPSWIAMMIDSEYLDLGAAGAPPSGDLVEIFDRSAADARHALSNASDAHLMQPWQLRVNGRIVDEKPRYIMITDTFSHLAHHRGQLTVYLRMNDVKVPSIYGPTADEGWG